MKNQNDSGYHSRKLAAELGRVLVLPHGRLRDAVWKCDVFGGNHPFAQSGVHPSPSLRSGSSLHDSVRSQLQGHVPGFRAAGMQEGDWIVSIVAFLLLSSYSVGSLKESIPLGSVVVPDDYAYFGAPLHIFDDNRSHFVPGKFCWNHSLECWTRRFVTVSLPFWKRPTSIL